MAATSASNAWAVGSTVGSDKTLILHWNGTTWKQVPSPSPRPRVPRPAWPRHPRATPGRSATPAAGTLVLHWNGKTWKRVPSPTPGLQTSPVPSTGGTLIGVGTVSAATAWAVGTTGDCGCGNGDSLILRWNGTGVEAGAQPHARWRQEGRRSAQERGRDLHE